MWTYSKSLYRAVFNHPQTISFKPFLIVVSITNICYAVSMVLSYYVSYASLWRSLYALNLWYIQSHSESMTSLIRWIGKRIDIRVYIRLRWFDCVMAYIIYSYLIRCSRAEYADSLYMSRLKPFMTICIYIYIYLSCHKPPLLYVPFKTLIPSHII